jgi:hypothetical protein
MREKLDDCPWCLKEKALFLAEFSSSGPYFKTCQIFGLTIDALMGEEFQIDISPMSNYHRCGDCQRYNCPDDRKDR